VAPERCAAVEDSDAGIRSAKAAGMRVLAIPNPHFPPGDEALALADEVVDSLAELTPERVAG
jgi:beta-phosphoglucomutase-like phosphatase (HAD superfamily)